MNKKLAQAIKDLLEALGVTTSVSSTNDWLKNHGVKGDAQQALVNANSTLTITAASGPFTLDDVGKICFGVEGASNLARISQRTIATYVSPTQVTLNGPLDFGNYTDLIFVWGTDDSDKIISAAAAAVSAGVKTLEFPGSYIFSKKLLRYSALNVVGQGRGKTVFYISPNYDFSTTSDNESLLFSFMGASRVSGFTVDGCSKSFNVADRYMLDLSRDAKASDVDVVKAQYGIYGGGSGLNWENVEASQCFASAGIELQGAQGILTNVKSTNCSRNMVIANTTPDGFGLALFGLRNDEGGTNIGSLTISNCQNISLHGSTLYGNSSCIPLNVINGSVVTLHGCQVAPFSYGQGDCDGVHIEAGSRLIAFGSKLWASGNGSAIVNEGEFTGMNLGNIIKNTSGGGVFN